jgi:hypothetical protein
MALRTIPVHKCLDKRLLIFGFEITDLFVLTLLLSVLSTFFGNSDGKLFSIWLPTAIVALVLRLAKRGKPDNFLLHWIRFQLRPPVLFAFPDPTIMPPPRRKKRA